MSKLSQILDKDKLRELETDLVPTLFTQRQFNILLKQLNNQELSTNEKVDLYRSVNKKIKAMTKLFNLKEQKLLIQGQDHIIPSRLEKAKKIIKKLSRNHKGMRITLAGSFLWNKKYKDIDIFIFSKYSKEDYKQGELHITYLPPSAQSKLFFQSAKQISISNFTPSKQKTFKISLDSIIMEYQKIVTSHLQKESFKQELRSFLLESQYNEAGVILNGKEINTLYNNIISKRNVIRRINQLLIQTLLISFKDCFLKKELSPLIHNNEELIKQYTKSSNLKIINETLREVISIGS